MLNKLGTPHNNRPQGRNLQCRPNRHSWSIHSLICTRIFELLGCTVHWLHRQQRSPHLSKSCFYRIFCKHLAQFLCSRRCICNCHRDLFHCKEDSSFLGCISRTSLSNSRHCRHISVRRSSCLADIQCWRLAHIGRADFWRSSEYTHTH